MADPLLSGSSRPRPFSFSANPADGLRDVQAQIGAHAAQECLQIVASQHAAAIDDRHALANRLDLFHVMAGVDGRHALGAQRANAIEQVGPRLGIDADGRLVEDQQPRPMQQGHSEIEPPFHSAGKVAGPIVGTGSEPRPLEGVGDRAT